MTLFNKTGSLNINVIMRSMRPTISVVRSKTCVCV